MIDSFLQTDWLTVITKIVLATALGYLIGMERELHGKVVGTRTISLIAIGSALYVFMSPSIRGFEYVRASAGISARLSSIATVSKTDNTFFMLIRILLVFFNF